MDDVLDGLLRVAEVLGDLAGALPLRQQPQHAELAVGQVAGAPQAHPGPGQEAAEHGRRQRPVAGRRRAQRVQEGGGVGVTAQQRAGDAGLDGLDQQLVVGAGRDRHQQQAGLLGQPQRVGKRGLVEFEDEDVGPGEVGLG